MAALQSCNCYCSAALIWERAWRNLVNLRAAPS